LASCRKDTQLCETYGELNDTAHLVDLALLKDVPQFLDTLKKYPQLQLTGVMEDEYMTAMYCNVFYKGLKLLNGHYEIFKHKRDGSIFCIDTIIDTINIDIKPRLTYKQAINTAKNALEFSDNFMYYRLGIYLEGRNPFNNLMQARLAWKVQNEGGTPFVIIDAMNGSVITKDDGFRY
jgi:hypothetical protein